MNRADLLESALDAVDKRPKSYGPPEQNFGRIAALWNIYMGDKYGEDLGLVAVDVACMMVLMKVARLEETPDHIDSWVDIAGYAACGAEVSTGVTIDAVVEPEVPQAPEGWMPIPEPAF